jgi:aldose 1-epimerase
MTPVAAVPWLCLSSSLPLRALAMPDTALKSSITREVFGTTGDGVRVERYTLKNRHGMEAKIATFGGVVTSGAL